MTTIDTEPGFDTLAYAQRLKAAGVEDKRAQAHAETARDSHAGPAAKTGIEHLATKADPYRALRIQTGAIAGAVVEIL